MSRMPPVRIMTAAKLKGPKWAAKYPAKADDLYVVVTRGKERQVERVETMEEAQALKADWDAALSALKKSAETIRGALLVQVVDKFKREALPDYAAKSREGRTYQLDRVLAILDPMTPVDQVTTDRVVELYDALRRDRSHRTAMAYLDALSKVFQWGELDNPVTLARTRITRKTPQTANARALNDANCNPVEPKAMAKLWLRLSGDLETVALLCHDAGLRVGEAMGLRWEDVTFGQDDADTRRAITVKRSRVNGRTGKTKSGRERTVLLSRRLRAHLLAKRMESGRKARGYIVEHSWPKTYHDQMGRACLAAKVPAIRFKDLRDTFASVLITNGIVLHWVSRQLGHASLTVTEKHYARYMALDGYRNPWMVPEGEVPSDLFAALERGGAGGRTKSAQIRTKVSK